MPGPGQPGDPQDPPPTAPAHDESPTAGSPPGAALRVDHLSKTFPGTRALIDVSFAVRPGEIHALVGGNGSGKSTLIKILAGVYHADPGGTITVGGTTLAADHTTPAKARALGLHFVHQNPAVFPALSVAENMVIGHGFNTTAAGSIRWRALRRQTQALLDRFEINVRPEALVNSLRPAERAMVAIARALQDQEGQHTGVLVLDEPTASLPRAEVVRLMGALNRFAAAGQTILFVSHRLDEVIDTAAEATVLRDGRLAGTLVGDEITEERLIEHIAGRTLDRMYPVMPAVESEEVALEAKALTGGPLRGVDFQLRRGEVLGVAGLLGSGRSELLKMIFGAYPIKSGTLLLGGKPVRFRDIGDAMAAGIAYVPEDRGGEAAFLDQSLADNVVASSISRYWRALRLRNRAIDHDARDIITRYFIRASSEKQVMGTLSGGNQQKVVLARWLSRGPRILLLDEPTQGVDVNARAEIYALISEAVGEGCSVLLVTSDFEELSRVADRAVVLSGGRVTAELRGAEIEPVRLTELAFSTQEVAS
ncbi:MAG TPA: sugar ABC transporter ATP-binding protein [Acidimicrobiales bacterium]|nr:sugar ABC transporter ATP-binding protein [Acidimicrobiales bacterium]